jgi:hypothetical protein
LREKVKKYISMFVFAHLFGTSTPYTLYYKHIRPRPSSRRGVTACGDVCVYIYVSF